MQKVRTSRRTTANRASKNMFRVEEHLSTVLMQVLLFIQLLLCTVLLFSVGEEQIPLIALIWAVGGIGLLCTEFLDRC